MSSLHNLLFLIVPLTICMLLVLLTAAMPSTMARWAHLYVKDAVSQLQADCRRFVKLTMELPSDATPADTEARDEEAAALEKKLRAGDDRSF